MNVRSKGGGVPWHLWHLPGSATVPDVYDNYNTISDTTPKYLFCPLPAIITQRGRTSVYTTIGI